MSAHLFTVSSNRRTRSSNTFEGIINFQQTEYLNIIYQCTLYTNPGILTTPPYIASNRYILTAGNLIIAAISR